MSITEIKAQVLKAGLSKEQVRLYGDLRFVETWEKALESVAVCLDISADLEECEGKPLDQQPEVAIPSENGCSEGEIIPFTHENNDLHLPPNRREIMLEEVARMREVFAKNVEEIADCPPPPPPPVIIRPCPIPERRDIPGEEIAETSPPPGHGRGDERLYPPDFNPHIDSIAEKATKMRAMFKATYPDEFKAMFPRENLGDRLFEKIKSDILRYFEGIKEDLEYCFELNYLENEDHYKEILSLVGLMEWNINNKHSIYDIWKTVPYFQREGFQKLIPFGIHEIFKDACLDPSCWECTRETYWLIIETPSAIPTLSEPYGGIFIPNKMHELGFYIYLWKFPGMVEAENFFDKITDARKYCMVPAKSDLKIFNQPVLVGV